MLLFWSLLANAGCRFSANDKKTEKTSDSFYSDLGGFGNKRIPLLKPYELQKVSEYEWRLTLQNPELLTLSIHNVVGVDVQDSIILVYSDGGTEFLNKQHQRAWFLIDASLERENEYSEFEKFRDEVDKKYKGLKIRFHSPDSLYISFDQTRNMTW